jgi:hypothetical protein
MNKGYYAIIPADVRYDVRLTPHAKLLYGEITALCNEKGFCWAMNEYFADLYSVSKVSVSKWVGNLRDCGYIEVQMQYKEGTKQISNRYIRLSTPLKENFNTLTKISLTPSQRKVKDPHKEKFKDNNTSNNTINNTSNIGETSSPVVHGEKDLVVKPKKPVKRFVPPTLQEVIDYCNQTQAGIDPLGFWSFYESKDWMVGKNKMKKWHAAVGTWKANRIAKNNERRVTKSDSIKNGKSIHEKLTDTTWYGE